MSRLKLSIDRRLITYEFHAETVIRVHYGARGVAAACRALCLLLSPSAIPVSKASKKQLSIRCFPWDNHALWPNVCIDASANAMIFIAVGRFTR